MPYINVIDGARIEIPDAASLAKSLDTSTEFQSLKEKVEGCALRCIDAYNEDDDVLAILVGTERYPDRHIYQGLSVPLDPPAAPLPDDLVQDIQNTISQIAGHPLTAKRGVFLYQFD